MSAFWAAKQAAQMQKKERKSGGLRKPGNKTGDAKSAQAMRMYALSPMLAAAETAVLTGDEKRAAAYYMNFSSTPRNSRTCCPRKRNPSRAWCGEDLSLGAVQFAIGRWARTPAVCLQAVAGSRAWALARPRCKLPPTCCNRCVDPERYVPFLNSRRPWSNTAAERSADADSRSASASLLAMVTCAPAAFRSRQLKSYERFVFHDEH
jgi:hypothetical protein